MRKQNKPWDCFSSKNNRVVIFIFTDGQKILVEKRFLESFDSEHYLIPGGNINNQENIADALQRELMEELGIKPLSFNLIPTDEEIIGIHGQHLILFLINKWEGNLPKQILDKGTQLKWIEIEGLLNSHFEPTRKIATALKAHLSKAK